MSWVTNVMVSFSVMEDESLLEKFNEWLMKDVPRWTDGTGGFGNVGTLRDITERETTQWGGPKYPEANVWAGALNHAYVPAIIDYFSKMPWRDQWMAQLFIMDQEQSTFQLWMIRDGEVHQYTPPELDTYWLPPLPDEGSDK